MKPWSDRVIAVLFLVWMGHWMPATSQAKSPYTPADDSVVVARLRLGVLDPAERQFRSARSALMADPGNLNLALEVARQAIRRGRADADPRMLGVAQAALGPWWRESVPPVEVLVLRATIRQSLHDFAAAIADLDAAVARDPRHAAAWVTKVVVHVVRGERAEARQAASHVVMLSDPLTASVVVALVARLEGRSAKAIPQLTRALERAAASGRSREDLRETAVWAGTVLAEMLADEKQGTAAEGQFRKALELAPRDPYLLGAFADFLLDQGRAPEVVSLLEDYRRVDGLLLRFVEAQRAVRKGSEASALADLNGRMEAARERGDRVHLREEARFHLRLTGDLARARRLAEENWEVQKEPADARLLVETKPRNP
jgi:tetratricopeptide (TPR) repeat protein